MKSSNTAYGAGKKAGTRGQLKTGVGEVAIKAEKAGSELKASRLRVHILEVEDELSQILDTVDIVMRWRRNQTDA